MLGDLTEQVQDRWGGDLRRMRKEADGDVTALVRTSLADDAAAVRTAVRD